MSRPVRICALGVPRFMHGGLEASATWTPIPTEPTTRQRETLRDFHGRFIQVHPEDRSALGEFGLAFIAQDKPLAELESKTGANGGGKNTTKKADTVGGK